MAKTFAARNEHVYRLHKYRQMPYRDIADLFGFSGTNAMLIFQRVAREKKEKKNLESLYGLSEGAKKVIRNYTGIGNPMLVDLQGMLASINKDGKWACNLRKLALCGNMRTTEIFDFAVANGIAPDILI